jgi:hypothetical protein
MTTVHKTRKQRTLQKRPKVKEVKLTPGAVLAVKIPSGMAPVVAQRKTGIIEIIPVAKKVTQKQGWLEYLFGYYK